ncbi:hypothetical protein ACIOG9_21095, partial [Streptomyces sp. NPDC088178]
MSDRGRRRPAGAVPPREHLRNTFWFAPAAGLLCSFVLWWGVSVLDAEIVTHLKDEQADEEVGDLAGRTKSVASLAKNEGAHAMAGGIHGGGLHRLMLKRPERS